MYATTMPITVIHGFPEKLIRAGCMSIKRSHFRRQSGQSLILALFFSLILSVGLFLVYNTGKLTTTKRDLVGAADAAAFSGASVIAQGLNYTAYTNRALYANNALIGQMTGVRSILGMSEWYWGSTEVIFDALQTISAFIPYIGPVISRIAGGISKFSGVWKDKIIHPSRIFAEVIGYVSQAALGLANQSMWVSQQIVLADSLAMFEPHMQQIAKENAPGSKVDEALHYSAFGPVVTAGMFAHKFKPKIRKSTRTIGSEASEKDEYLQYFTEAGGRGVHALPFIYSRYKLPNAVGLGAATGCDSGPTAATGGLSGLFSPAVADYGDVANTALTAVDTFLSILGLFANPIMCLYDRAGGSELIQLEDGKLAWLAVDVMDFKVPFFDINIPFAGGAAMTFMEKKGRGGEFSGMPDSVAYWEDRLEDGDLNLPKSTYLGSQGQLVPDCVEFIDPINRNMYAISTNSRTSGNCAVLAGGSNTRGTKGGIYGGPMKDTARKTLRSGDSDASAIEVINSITADLTTSLTNALNPVEGALNSAAISDTQPTSGVAVPMPGGLTADAGSSANSGLPNVAGLLSAGGAMLASPFIAASGALKGAIGNMASNLNPVNFLNFNVNVSNILKAGVSLGNQIPGGGLIELLSGWDISDGVELPRNDAMNKAFNLLADGLPPYIWDIRVTDAVQGRPKGFQEAEELQISDGNFEDYNERRYNLGPLVYLPLMMENKKIKTVENEEVKNKVVTREKLGGGGKIISLPDYHGSRDAMKALGKARIFYRQPQDQWTARLKRIATANLVLPYWQVRNESLSYVDKWGLLLLDGLVGVPLKVASESDTPDTPDTPDNPDNP